MTRTRRTEIRFGFLLLLLFCGLALAAGAEKAQATTGGTAGCRIKGNISAKCERIYHMPGQAFYARTDIEPDKGERWFCTEAEAKTAGWRASER